MKTLSASLQAGLAEVKGWTGDKSPKIRTTRIPAPDVKTIRQKLGMSQDMFAQIFCFSPATLRHWERGDRQPRGAACTLLRIIDQAPKTALAALKASRAE